MFYKILIAIALSALVSGCATELTPAGEKVRVITANQRDGCRFIKLVTVRASAGGDKPANALKGALNEVGAAGGNGLFIITTSATSMDGASVAGEALTCSPSLLGH